MGTVTSATAASVLAVLTKARLVELARSFDLALAPDAAKAAQVAAITAAEARLDAAPRRSHSPAKTAFTASSTLDEVGRALHEARAAFMQSTNQGLTTTHNLLKDTDVDAPAIVALRALQLELDRAVLAAYGWADIPVPAYTDPVTDADWKAREAFEDELIDRLFALNATRATAERLRGPTPSTKPKPAPKPKKPKPASPELPLDAVPRKRLAKPTP